jgi:NAD+ synthase (glutamine-hydrolysing)
MKPFDSLYSHGMVRVAVGTPQVELCSPDVNAHGTLELARQAAKAGSILILFPELGNNFLIEPVTQYCHFTSSTRWAR